jgi:hypothetical protein
MNSNREIQEGVLLTSEDQLDGDTAEELASFIDDMNSTENADAYITVLRIPTDSRGTPLPNSKHMGQLFHELLGRSTVNDVIERVRAQFIRPPDTSITVRIMGKRPGERKLLFNRIYTIEKASAPSGKESGSVAEMLALMQQNADQQAQRTENFMRELMTMQRTTTIAPAESIVDQLVKLSPLLTPLITGLLGRPLPPPGGGATELLATVRTLKEASNLFGVTDKGDGDTMSTVKAVAEAIGPGLKFLAARAETERMSVAQRVKQLPAPAKAATPKAGPKAPPPIRPTPKAPPASATNNNSNQEGEDVNLKDLREKLQVVATMCDEGQTPEAVATLIVDNCEDDELEELYRRVEPENFISSMKVLAPSAVSGREEWFGKLRLAILAEYEDDPDEVPADGGDGSTAEDLGADPVDVSEIPDVTN